MTVDLAVAVAGERLRFAHVDSRIQIRNFRIDPSVLGPTLLPDCGFSSPGRYAQAMAERLDVGVKRLVFNPSLELPSVPVVAVIRAARGHAGPAVWSSREGVPLAWLLPQASLASRFLSLVSAWDASVDASLLAAALDGSVPVLSMAFSVRGLGRGGFPGDRIAARLNTTYATHATECLQRHGTEVPWGVVMPFHAGDVLFCGLAHQALGADQLWAVARDYVPIAEELVRAEIVTVPIVPPQRPDGVADEETHLFGSLDFLRRARSDVLWRPLRRHRPYDRSEHHMVDQFAFALGRDFVHPEDLAWPRLRVPAPTRPVRRDPLRRVLVHLGAGWAMKVYPDAMAHVLLERLESSGLGITLLDPPAGFSAHQTARFESLGQFRKLLTEHDALIGMDSFPAHYAAYVHGLPTVELFGNTSPTHSRGPQTGPYAALAAGLPCAPCGTGRSRCPLDDGPVCNNFVPPGMVVEALHGVL